MNKDEKKKTTSEKPISLSPLDFKEALVALLNVKPKPKESDKPKEKNDKEEKSSG